MQTEGWFGHQALDTIACYCLFTLLCSWRVPWSNWKAAYFKSSCAFFCRMNQPQFIRGCSYRDEMWGMRPLEKQIGKSYPMNRICFFLLHDGARNFGLKVYLRLLEVRLPDSNGPHVTGPFWHPPRSKRPSFFGSWFWWGGRVSLRNALPGLCSGLFFLCTFMVLDSFSTANVNSLRLSGASTLTQWIYLPAY